MLEWINAEVLPKELPTRSETMKSSGAVPSLSFKGVKMSYKMLNQNQRKAVKAFMDPKNKGEGLEIINQVAQDIGLKPNTIIRYLANPDFMETITNVTAGLKNRGKARDASVDGVATE